MRHVLILAVLCLWLGLHASEQAPAATSLAQLYEQHRWFELKEAISDGNTPPLYQGAVASAFNKMAAAETHLRRAIRDAADAAAANEARGVLALAYMRSGRSADAGRLIDEILAIEPGRSDIRNMRSLFGAFSDRQNQVLRTRRDATVACEVTQTGVHMPLTVNGKPMQWLLDTAANVMVVSQSEARRADLTLATTNGNAADLAGGTAQFRSAVAKRIVIAGAEVENVPVIVLPDTQGPWDALPPGKEGLIGLPLILALEAIRWTRDGGCQAGAAVAAAEDAGLNLAFDGVFPLVRAQYAGKPLDFVLDTGNQAGTQLWERFAADFAPLVNERGVKGTARVTQVGGSFERAVVRVPEVVLHLGGAKLALTPATIFSKPVGDERRHGNLGMDALSQAREVTIDFQAMSVTLR